MTTIRNKIKAVIFDWARVTLDYGSRTSTEVFIELVNRSVVELPDRLPELALGGLVN